ncbi:MAG: small conductance mechanosensitive channel [Polyangiales bacterium]|jgi:small conductance mechanosensitive channel
MMKQTQKWLGTLTALFVSGASSAFAQEAEAAAESGGGFELTPAQMLEWGESAVPYILKAFGALIVFWIGRRIIDKIVRLLNSVMEKRAVDPTVTRFGTNLLSYALLAGLVLGILGYFGVDTTSFAALIGAMGLAVGLALQGTLGNFAAGVMLLVFKPFKVGDFINAGGSTGTVEELGIFSTTFKTLDNKQVIVPNGKVFGDTIINVGHNPIRRVDIDVGCDYGADIDECRATLENVVAHIPDMIKDPAPQIFLKGLGGSSVDWQVRIWCDTPKYWDVHQQTVRAIKKVLDEKGIGIPFPQMDVHLDK